MEIYKSLKENISYFQSNFKGSDIKYYFFDNNEKSFALIYIDGLIDKQALFSQIVQPFTTFRENMNIEILSPESEKLFTAEDINTEVLNGNAVLLLNGETFAYSIGVKSYPVRAISEPPTSTVIKGSREGFIEDLKGNLVMLRRRLKSEELKIDMMKVGYYTKTAVAICYIDKVAKKELVTKIKSTLENVQIDGVIDSSYIAKLLLNGQCSLFKKTNSTEKPDILTAKILEGRIAIIVDGSPLVITLPYVILEDFQSPEDYYTSIYRANISRVLRLLAITLSVLLPAFFVSAQIFHLQLIPLRFLITLINGIKGIPLSPAMEMFFILLMFEILNEASVRMPKYVGMALSVVGALILGDTAVKAGIVSTPTIMIMALSGIAMYTVPDMVETLSILRLIFLFIAGSLGGYGIIACGLLILAYLASADSFGTPLLAPFSPKIKDDLGDGFIMKPLTKRGHKIPKTFSKKSKVF